MLGLGTVAAHATETSADLNTSNTTEQCQSLAPLSFLVGNWRHSEPQQVVTETWQQVSEDTFEGEGEFVEQKSVESLRLVKMLDGIFYLAKPRSNPLPVAFKLIECADNKFVFVNEATDFPQKITYVRSANDVLLVDVTTLEGKGFSLTLIKQE